MLQSSKCVSPTIVRLPPHRFLMHRMPCSTERKNTLRLSGSLTSLCIAPLEMWYPSQRWYQLSRWW